MTTQPTTKASAVLQPRPTTTMAVATAETSTTRIRVPMPPEPDAIENPTVVASRFGDFELTIPGDWLLLNPSADQLSNLGTGLGDSLPGVSGSALVDDAASVAEMTALWAQSGVTPGFRENIQVLEMPRPAGLDLSTLSKTALEDVGSLGLVNIAIGEIQLAGLEGFRLTSETPPGPTVTVFEASVFLLNSEQVWIINFATDNPATFGLLESILATFQLLIPSN